MTDRQLLDNKISPCRRYSHRERNWQPDLPKGARRYKSYLKVLELKPKAKRRFHTGERAKEVVARKYTGGIEQFRLIKRLSQKS